MDKIIEDAEYLTIGRFKIDVSNVSIYRKKIARTEWNNSRDEMSSNDGNSLIVFDSIIDTYGLYMIRQDFAVLRRRMSFIEALKSYIKRYLLSVRYIRKSNEEEYNAFQEWAYFQITGAKKKDLEKINQIQKIELAMLKEMENLNLEPEQLTALLRTFLQETVGNMNTSQVSQKA